MNASSLDKAGGAQPSQISEPSIRSLQPIHSPEEGETSLHGDQLKPDSQDSNSVIELNLFQDHRDSSLPRSSFSEGSLNRSYREGKGWFRLKEGSWREGIPHGAHKPGDTSFKFTKAPDFKMPASSFYRKVHPRRFLKQYPHDWAVINMTCCRYRMITRFDSQTIVFVPTSEMANVEIRRKRDPETVFDEHQAPRDSYIVIGIFPCHGSAPKEKFIALNKPENLFFSLFLGIIQLRGWEFIFSLKDVKEFQLYECYPSERRHKILPITEPNMIALEQFLHVYKSWRRRDSNDYSWIEWIHENLNSNSLHSAWGWETTGSVHLSLRVVLGWSPIKISVAILLLVLLSLAMGIMINSSNWKDPAIIQTAWGVASYVATAGSLLVVLLALISSLDSSKTSI